MDLLRNVRMKLSLRRLVLVAATHGVSLSIVEVSIGEYLPLGAWKTDAAVE